MEKVNNKIVVGYHSHVPCHLFSCSLVASLARLFVSMLICQSERHYNNVKSIMGDENYYDLLKNMICMPMCRQYNLKKRIREARL